MHLQLFTREVTITEEMSVINEPKHVAVGLQLLEISSITTIQFRMFVQGTFFKEFFFRKQIGNFIDLRLWKDSVR